jgi:E3 ubiquitin-protein ligase UBR1
MLVGNGSGGCCDCGDPEAFNPGSPRCGIHVASTPDRQPPLLPAEVRESIKETMETALDFIIDVFSHTPMTKLEISDDWCAHIQDLSRLLYPEIPPEEEDEPDGWVLILYNDESHSYKDVINKLKAVDSKLYDDKSAKEVATTIDNVGREIIKVYKTLEEAVEGAQTFLTIDLFCAVRTVKDGLREAVAGYVLQWLKDCISIGVSVGGDEMILREVLCQSLAGQWQRGVQKQDTRIELRGTDLGKRERDDWDVPKYTSGPIEERWVDGEYIRLDWILFLDARLWKTLRKGLKSIILGCLLGGKAEVAGTAVDLWGPRNWKRITGNSSVVRG